MEAPSTISDPLQTTNFLSHSVSLASVDQSQPSVLGDITEKISVQKTNLPSALSKHLKVSKFLTDSSQSASKLRKKKKKDHTRATPWTKPTEVPRRKNKGSA